MGERLYVTPHLILHTPYSILHTPHSTLSTPHFTLYTLHLTLQTLHLTLCTLHLTLCPIHSTLYARHFTLCTVHSPHNSQSPPPTVMILSLLVHRLLEAQTICSTRSYKIWSCNEISKRNLHCFWPLPPLVLLPAPSEHAPVELDGKDTVHGRNDVEHFQRIATAHITFLWICQSETSSIHLFKNNQWFETVQNYCLRSLLFSRWRSLAKIFSWQLLNLHIEILIVR